MSHRLDLQRIHIHMTITHADLQHVSALQVIIMVNVYDLDIYQWLALAHRIQKTVSCGTIIICTEIEIKI